MTNPYLAPVSGPWRRVAGMVLLFAGAVLTALLGYRALQFVTQPALRHAFTSSSLVVALILLALCGICWQAGYRLAFNRPDRSGTLFSRPAWLAIGAGLVVVTALMAAVILAARRPTLLDVQVILFLGGLGVWCLLLGLRRTRDGAPPAD